jgi:hypothetical protein
MMAKAVIALILYLKVIDVSCLIVRNAACVSPEQDP